MPNADTYADYQVLSGGQHTLDAAASASEVEKVRFSVSQTGKIDIENVVMWYQVRDEH